jgi:hypothetical protein
MLKLSDDHYVCVTVCKPFLVFEGAASHYRLVEYSKSGDSLLAFIFRHCRPRSCLSLKFAREAVDLKLIVFL